jgi:hypothetical protein
MGWLICDLQEAPRWLCHNLSLHKSQGAEDMQWEKLVPDQYNLQFSFCHSWLKHYATSWKIMSSIPDEAIGFFNWPNPSSPTLAQGSTQPIIEMSTRNRPGGKGRPVHKADDLTAICEKIVYKMWQPQRLTTLWVSMICYRDSFTFTILLSWNFLKK